jgi:hypothetical protein
MDSGRVNGHFALAHVGCARFRSVTEAIDTTTPGGRLVFHLFKWLRVLSMGLVQNWGSGGNSGWRE